MVTRMRLGRVARREAGNLDRSDQQAGSAGAGTDDIDDEAFHPPRRALAVNDRGGHSLAPDLARKGPG